VRLVAAAAHFAAQGVIAGAYDIVVAAGVEVMTPPRWAPRSTPVRLPDGPQGSGARYAPEGGLVPQGISAEMIADKWGLTREDLDAFGPSRASSVRRRATAEGRFEREIIPVLALRPRDRPWSAPTRWPARGHHASSRSPSSSRRSAEENGRVTAGNSSQITDGASAMLIMSEEKAKRARSHPPGPLPHFASPAPTRG
jgi:acetyl-CoA acyltransferase